MGILEGSKNDIIWGDSGGGGTVLQRPSDRGTEQETNPAYYIHSNDVLLPSPDSPRNFFIREV